MLFFENQHTQCSKHKRVGGMTRGKAISSTTIIIHDMHKVTNTTLEVLRARTIYQWAYNFCTSIITQRKGNTKQGENN